MIVAQEVIPATGHALSEEVKENEVEPTYDTEGGYDLVKRCTNDGCTYEEVSHVTVPKLEKEEVVVETNDTDLVNDSNVDEVKSNNLTYFLIAGGIVISLVVVAVTVTAKNKKKYKK